MQILMRSFMFLQDSRSASSFWCSTLQSTLVVLSHKNSLHVASLKPDRLSGAQPPQQRVVPTIAELMSLVEIRQRAGGEIAEVARVVQ